MDLVLAFIIGVITTCVLFLVALWFLDRKYGSAGKDD